MPPSVQKLLVVYSALLSTALLGLVLMGAASPRKTDFDEIRAHRIDIVEPDGTLRMVIANKDRLPPVIIKGKERPRMGEPRPQAGMLFYNDEGTENGGLIFGGHMNAKGEVVDSGGSLSFDKYGDGQIVQLAGVDDKDDQFAGLRIGHAGQRVWIGRDRLDNASVSLTDANGRKRIVIQVDAKGSPSIAFFDSEGHLQSELLPKN